MILVDFIYSYLISIVLLGITYLYLAETKSIRFPEDTTSINCESARQQTYLIYTTGLCFKYYKLNSNNLTLETESLRKINLTDCESTQKAIRTFDYYFDETYKLNLIAFDKKNGQLVNGQLNLTTSLFHLKQIYGFYDQINFAVDRQKKIVYISNKKSNRIESIDLIDGKKKILNVICNSPDYIQFKSDQKLVWIEHVPSNNDQFNRSDPTINQTCFYEWSLKESSKTQLACVKQKVQSFELHFSSVYFITKNGSLFKLYLNSEMIRQSNLNSNKVQLNSSTNFYATSLSSTKLIYNTIAHKRKYQTQIYRFKLMIKQSSVNLYLSDLIHQGLLLANLNNANESNGQYTPKIVFTDQPSLFDFKFINENDCQKPNNAIDDEDLNKFVLDNLSDDKSVNRFDNESNNNKINFNDFTIHKIDAKSNVEKNSSLKETEIELSKELTKELKSVNDLNKGRSNQPILNSSNIDSNSKHTNPSTNEQVDEFCLTCSPNLIYLIVFITLVLVLILSALAIVFFSKRRYNTLIGNKDESQCCFKRKLNNIHFNIKKTIQTI